jgi:hypothetical protein
VLALSILFKGVPVEMYRRSEDEAKERQVALIGATIMTFALTYDGQYPWNVSSDEYEANPRQPVSRFNSDELGLAWITAMAQVSGLSSSSTKEIVEFEDLHIFKETGSPAPIYLCFVPQSKSKRDEALLACQEGRAPRISNTQVCEGDAALLCFAYDNQNVPGASSDPDASDSALPAFINKLD